MYIVGESQSIIRWCCINSHLNSDLFTFNKYCMHKLYRKMLYNKLFFGIIFKIFKKCIENKTNEEQNQLSVKTFAQNMKIMRIFFPSFFMICQLLNFLKKKKEH